MEMFDCESESAAVAACAVLFVLHPTRLPAWRSRVILMKVGRHHVIDMIAVRIDPSDVAPHPIASQPSGIGKNRHSKVKPCNGGMVAAIK